MTHPTCDLPDNVPDELVPDPQVAREFNVSLMTLWRWDRDPSWPSWGGNRPSKSEREITAGDGRLRNSRYRVRPDRAGAGWRGRLLVRAGGAVRNAAASKRRLEWAGNYAACRRPDRRQQLCSNCIAS